MLANGTSNPVADGASSDSQQCRDYALFFRHLPGWCAAFGFPVFVIISIILIIWLNVMITPSDKPVDPPATATPEPNAVPPEADGDLPPPYQQPSTSDDTTAALPPTAGEAGEPPKKRTSAEAFVNGSALFVCLILSEIFAPLALQAGNFCFRPYKVPRFLLISCWVAYGILTLSATSGAACWLLLLRNLWGPRMIKKYPIDHAFAPFLVLGVVISPLFGVVYALRGLARGCALMIESWQRRFCGDALEDEVEDSQQDVELEAGRRFGVRDDENENENETGEGEGSRRAQERQGLMKAFESV